MSEIKEVPEEAEFVSGVRPSNMRDSYRIIAKTEEGDVYVLGRNPEIYTEKVGWPENK